MLVDVVLFDDELDLLELRLRSLDRIVSHWVLVESTQTPAGRPKPLTFLRECRAERFRPFLERIVHVVVDDLPGEDPENRESYLRDQALHGLALLPQLAADDLVILSDVDELPRVETLAYIQEDADLCGRQCALCVSRYAYTPRCRVPGDWFGPRVLPVARLTRPHEHRRTNALLEDEYPLFKAGWRFSFFRMGPAQIRRQVTRYGEPPSAPAGWLEDERILAAVRECRDVRPDGEQYVRLEPLDLPPLMLAHLEDWEQPAMAAERVGGRSEGSA